MPAISDIAMVLIGCAALSGTAAFLGLFSRRDSRTRLRAIGALTLGLFIGFSIVWGALAIYLRSRFADDSTPHVPYLGVQVGVAVASVLCGLMFSERSADSAPPPNLTVFGGRWVSSPPRAFRTGVAIGMLAPTGFGALLFVFWAISTMVK